MKNLIKITTYCIIVLVLFGCSRNIIFSNGEMSWTELNRRNDSYNMSISAAGKKAIITSNNGGTLDKYLINGEDIFEGSNWNHITVFNSNTGDILNSIKLINYSSNNNNSSGVSSSINDKLRMMSYFDMNLDTGDMFISRRLLPLRENVTDIGSYFELNLKKGGYMILPISVISKYKNGYESLGFDGKKTKLKNSFEFGNKFVFKTDGENCVVRTDATDNYFAYIYGKTMLLVNYTTLGGKIDNGVTVTINKDSIKIKFCTNTRRLISILDPLELRENLALIRLNLTPLKKDDLEKVFDDFKIPLILDRFQ